MKRIIDFFSKNCDRNIFFISGVFVLFLVFRILSRIYLLTDSYEYLEVARQINSFSILDTKRPFIYPLFLVTALHTNFIFILTLQTIIGILTFIIFNSVLKMHSLELKNKYLWFLVFTPSVYIYTQLIMSEWIVMFFITIILWLISKKWSSRNFAFIQVVTVLLAFTKPVFYPFIYVSFIFFVIYFIKNKIFSFWLFIPLIILQLYLGFNEKKTGYRHFSSIENINLINYNLYYFKSASASKKEADAWLKSIYNDEYDKKDFKEKNQYLNNIAQKEIKQNFVQYTLYHIFTSIRGTVDPGRFDLMTFFQKENGKQGFLEILNTKKSIFSLFTNKFVMVYILLIPIFLFNLIKWFYLLKYIALNKLNFLNYYILILLFYTILITGPVNCSRYIMPLQIIIFYFAIKGFVDQKRILNFKFLQ